MKVNAGLISLWTALVLGVTPAYASSSKSKTSVEKIVQGTVVIATDADLIIRKGKADVTLMYDSTTQKPAVLAPGTSVLVHA